MFWEEQIISSTNTMKNAAYYDVIHYKYNSDIMIVIMSYTINYVFYKQCRVGHSPHLAEGLVAPPCI